MSDEKHSSTQGGHDLESHGIRRSLTAVTLTSEQFESLYLQPTPARSPLVGRVGNATPLGITCFLLVLIPFTMGLLGFQGATAGSSLATLGAFYACGGVGLWVSAIMEWVVGNTFPMIIFGSFGGFVISYGILIQPSFRVAAAFAPPNMTDDTFAGVASAAAGAASPSYNAGIGLYFVAWALVCFIYAVAATRTNVPFLLMFITIAIAFSCTADLYFSIGKGNIAHAAHMAKIAGGFSFATALAGLWIDTALILASVNFPIQIPVLDLSTIKFMQPRIKSDHVD